MYLSDEPASTILMQMCIYVYLLLMMNDDYGATASKSTHSFIRRWNKYI